MRKIYISLNEYRGEQLIILELIDLSYEENIETRRLRGDQIEDIEWV